MFLSNTMIKKKEVVLLLVVAILIVSCADKADKQLEEELEKLSDEELEEIVAAKGEKKALAGKSYAYRFEEYLDYRILRTALRILEERRQYKLSKTCSDSDGVDYLVKGTVTDLSHPEGKEDYCHTFPNGKTYLFEGRCVGDGYQYIQKNCAELGAEYRCAEGKCFAPEEFVIDILVDKSTTAVTEEEITMLIEKASTKLLELTGNVVFKVNDIFYYNDFSEYTSHLMVPYNHYLNNPEPSLNGIIVLTDNFGTTTSGGYSAFFHVDNYCNSFKSPVPQAADHSIYVVMMDWDHKVAPCGYNEQGVHVSDVAIGSECKNSPGTACVYNPTGSYYMCETHLDKLYADVSYYKSSGVIIHEFAHQFGLNGAFDHYGTQQCNEALGKKLFDYNDKESEEFCVMCPTVYETFSKSKVGCG